MSTLEDQLLINLAENEDRLIHLGEYTARLNGGSISVTYPVVALRVNDVDETTDFDVYLHSGTGTLLYKPIEETGE